MANKAFILTIEKPCSRNWDSMETSAMGKYCSHCSKHVIDLTRLSDSEIFALIKKTKGELCGRMTENQLEHVFVQPGMSYSIPYVKKMLAGILVMSGTGSAVYSKNTGVPTEQVLNERMHGLKTEPLMAPPDTLRNIFFGTITDKDTHEPLIGAVIIISGTQVGAVTDVDGNFRLKIPQAQLMDSMWLDVQYIGYETKQLKISHHDLITEKAIALSAVKGGEPIIITTGAITLKQEPVLMGEVVYVKKKWWKRKRR